MLAIPLTEHDDESADEAGAIGRDEPEYSFEGFSVEFSDKVMLTPIVTSDTTRQPAERRHDR
ncbi:MAG: hypothetical protein HYU37_16360 [Acidobacteria bacterium]|nr:hypothetical protein [Acidobacteriota bacterium]